MNERISNTLPNNSRIKTKEHRKFHFPPIPEGQMKLRPQKHLIAAIHGECKYHLEGRM